ncbi:hypothetical protein IW262DRAFT_1295945 [Armillaria fumosa]|nr:hypothetical protein IW262DRAFT_1295945 [Armillaria fumosa]
MFKQLRVTKKSNNSFDYTDSLRHSCKILVERAQPPESMGLHPASAYGIMKDANYSLPGRTNDQIVPVLKDLTNSGVDLRQPFLDGKKRDRLEIWSLGFAIPIGPEDAVDAITIQHEKKTKDDVVINAAKMTVKYLLLVVKRQKVVVTRLKLQVSGSTTQFPILHYRIRGRMRGARKKRTSCQVHFIMSQEQMSCGIKGGLLLVPPSKLLSDVLQHWCDYVLAESEEVDGYSAYIQALLSVTNKEDSSASIGMGWNSPSQRVRMRLFCEMFADYKDAWGRFGNDILWYRIRVFLRWRFIAVLHRYYTSAIQFLSESAKTKIHGLKMLSGSNNDGEVEALDKGTAVCLFQSRKGYQNRSDYFKP